MNYQQRQTQHEVTLEPAQSAVATVILLHGLGADGWDFVPIVEELGLAEPVRWIFPHAPERPVTVNAGYVMRAWYDIKSFTPEGRADAAGLAESVQRVYRYLDVETERGMAAGRIVLAGFSQGGAVALSAALRHPQRLAGVLALSTYLPFPARLATEKSTANADVPILMCHGQLDPVVDIGMGREARAVLEAQGYAVEWHEYPMEHEVCAVELEEIGRWLVRRFGPEPATRESGCP
ncbi:MAG: alpha/beta hydrolase [Burkholderiales bacterium]|jgi:phospholipase/carboxylesterase|nr:alpha/beta hydrolase [Burkholderiales bacterium]